MHSSARVTTKGQVTIPKAVREALKIEAGDHIVFRVEGSRAVMTRTPEFLDLAGVVRVSAEHRNHTWDDVVRRSTGRHS